MTKLNKAFSLLLALVMTVTCLGFSTTAYAADNSKCVTISFKGKENNAVLAAVVNDINATRAAKGIAPVTLDSNLTNLAKQRAKEIVVYWDYNENLPNGDPITTRMSGYGMTVDTGFTAFSSVPSAYSLESYLSILTDDQYGYLFNSVGLGLFTYGSVTTYYMIVATDVSYSAYTDFSNKSVTAKVNTLISNLDLRFETKSESSKYRYKYSLYARTPNGYASGITLPNSQFNVKSNKTSVMKVKGDYCYVKGNGKFTITATNKSNSKFKVNWSQNVSGFTKPKTAVTLKSSKKKQMTVKWKKIGNSNGYEIQYSTSSKFAKKQTKTVTVKGQKSVSKTISKLKSKKKYYVRVRAYKDQGNGEKFYSTWSKTKSIKVK